jgi:hypothetical protein
MKLSRTDRGTKRLGRGQAMVEFALIAGLFFVVLGGVIQFATILWSQNTVTHIARDTARWAATQMTSPCDGAAMRTAIAGTANRLALDARLAGYSNGMWTTAGAVGSVGPEGVGATWPTPERPSDIPVAEWPTLFPTDCPPSDNRVPWAVRVQVNHAVPIFMPGLQFIAPPCSANSFCVSSTAESRIEPRTP